MQYGYLPTRALNPSQPLPEDVPQVKSKWMQSFSYTLLDPWWRLIDLDQTLTTETLMKCSTELRYATFKIIDSLDKVEDPIHST